MASPCVILNIVGVKAKRHFHTTKPAEIDGQVPGEVLKMRLANENVTVGQDDCLTLCSILTMRFPAICLRLLRDTLILVWNTCMVSSKMIRRNEICPSWQSNEVADHWCAI
jgi:hypothetical protein